MCLVQGKQKREYAKHREHSDYKELMVLAYSIQGEKKTN